MSQRRRSTYSASRRRGAAGRLALAGPILALAAIAALAIAALSSGSVQSGPVATGPLSSLPDIPVALAADAAAQPAHLELIPLPAAARAVLAPGYSLPSLIAAGRSAVGSAAPAPAVYVAELTYVERNGAGSPLPGSQGVSARPVYVLYYTGLSGFALGGRSYRRFLLIVDIATGAQITGSGLP